MENLKMENLTYQEIQNKYAEKGYAFFGERPFDLNIFGIRSSNIEHSKDLFDDIYGIAYLDEGKNPRLFVCKQTTDPGLQELISPSFYNAQQYGTAIMAEGQYRSCWAIGFIGSGNWRHKCLVQVGNISFYRDANKNNILDMDVKKKETSAVSGLCNHASALYGKAQNVKNYSAGCQVLEDSDGYYKALYLWESQVRYGLGNTFSYTLFNEKDFGTQQEVVIKTKKTK